MGFSKLANLFICILLNVPRDFSVDELQEMKRRVMNMEPENF